MENDTRANKLEHRGDGKTTCSLCGTPVRIVGKTTMYYEPIAPQWTDDEVNKIAEKAVFDGENIYADNYKNEPYGNKGFKTKRQCIIDSVKKAITHLPKPKADWDVEAVVDFIKLKRAEWFHGKDSIDEDNYIATALTEHFKKPEIILPEKIYCHEYCGHNAGGSCDCGAQGWNECREETKRLNSGGKL